MARQPLGIKLGADPEFEFEEDGRLIPACELLPFEGSLGCDGHNSTAELRPRAGAYYEVMRHINSLIGQAAEQGYSAYAGSGILESLGGHIHFSGIDPSCLFLDKLAVFITIPLNSVSIMDVRARYDYGAFRLGYNRLDRRQDMSEYRWQPHGWEYRAPLSWISTPILCRGVLAIAGVLARCAKLEKLRQVKTQADLCKLAYKGERVAIKQFYDTLENYKNDGTKLESIEIFKAWGKTKGLNRVPSNRISFGGELGLPTVQDAIFYSTDSGDSTWKDFSTIERTRIVGISNSRIEFGDTSEYIIFIHPDLKKYLPKRFRFRVITDANQIRCRIGFSRSLREDLNRVYLESVTRKLEMFKMTADLVKTLCKAVNRMCLADIKTKPEPEPEKPRNLSTSRRRDYDDPDGEYEEGDGDDDEDSEDEYRCHNGGGEAHSRHCGVWTCTECADNFGHPARCRYDDCEYCNTEYGSLPSDSTEVFNRY